MAFDKAERVTDVSFVIDDGTGRIGCNRWYVFSPFFNFFRRIDWSTLSCLKAASLNNIESSSFRKHMWHSGRNKMRSFSILPVRTCI